MSVVENSCTFIIYSNLMIKKLHYQDINDSSNELQILTYASGHHVVHNFDKFERENSPRAWMSKIRLRSQGN